MAGNIDTNTDAKREALRVTSVAGFFSEYRRVVDDMQVAAFFAPPNTLQALPPSLELGRYPTDQELMALAELRFERDWTVCTKSGGLNPAITGVTGGYEGFDASQPGSATNRWYDFVVKNVPFAKKHLELFGRYPSAEDNEVEANSLDWSNYHRGLDTGGKQAGLVCGVQRTNLSSKRASTTIATATSSKRTKR